MINLQRLIRMSTFVAGLYGCAATFAQPPAQPAPAPTAATPDAVAAEAPHINPALTPEANPAIRAALELPREKPADFFQAVSWLVELGRPDLAKPILEELATQRLNDAQRVSLVEQFGSGAMLKLARTRELEPTGAQFAEACMAAAATASQN